MVLISHATSKAGAGSESKDMRSIPFERERSEYLMTAVCSKSKHFPCAICYCDLPYLQTHTILAATWKTALYTLEYGLIILMGLSVSNDCRPAFT